MLKTDPTSKFGKQEIKRHNASGRLSQAQARKSIQRFRRRLERDGEAEALRSFIRAAIGQEDAEK